MSTKSKLIERFRQFPKDFTFDEVVRLFLLLGFTVDNKGKTSGSRVEFVKGEESFHLHKPHPSKIIKETSLKKIYRYLITNELI